MTHVQCWDAYWSHLAIFLRDIDSFQGFWFVSFVGKTEYCFHLVSSWCSHNTIDAGCFAPFVFRDSLHCKEFGMMWMRQQSCEFPYFVPFTFFGCSCKSRLKVVDSFLNCIPVNGSPLIAQFAICKIRTVGYLWMSYIHTNHSLLLDAPVISQHAFALGQILNPYPAHYTRAFASYHILCRLCHCLALQPCYPLGTHTVYQVPYER